MTDKTNILVKDFRFFEKCKNVHNIMLNKMCKIQNVFRMTIIIFNTHMYIQHRKKRTEVNTSK